MLVMKLNKEIAVVTGATSGLGLSYAKRLAEDGYNLIITGRREEIVKANAKKIEQQYNCNVEVCIADLSNESGVNKLIGVIGNRNISFLVNNAGFGLKTTFEDTNYHDIERLLYLQIMALTKLTYFVLHGMRRQNKGTIINISSDGAFAVLPRNVVYSSSKLYIINFTEGLHMELKDCAVKVQAVCPGFIDSDFHARAGISVDKARKGMFGFHKPEDIMKHAMRDLEKNIVVCVPDQGGKLIKLIGKYMPRNMFYKYASWFSSSIIKKNHKISSLK